MAGGLGGGPGDGIAGEREMGEDAAWGPNVDDGRWGEGRGGSIRLIIGCEIAKAHLFDKKKGVCEL